MADLDTAPAGWLTMMNTQLLNRSGLAAIAAATAFLSTPVMAQEAAPTTADPAPIVADAPLPDDPAPAAEPATEATAPVAKAVAKRTSIATASKTLTATRRITPVKEVARPTAATVAAAPAIAAEPTAAPADPAMVAPLPETVAATAVAPAATNTNDVLPIAGAAGLGILALAGAGFVLRRRRREEDDVVTDETWIEPERVASTPIVATPVATAPIPAFAWGDKPAAAAPVAAAKPTTTDWIEAAKRGPTPENPSASLKKRLARAAFFDRREKLVASGKAAPVDAMAGLPDALDSGDLEPAPPVSRTSPAVNTGFDRRFQLA